MTLLGYGARSLVPDELIDGYGEDPALPEGWLIRPGFPLSGRVVRRAGYPSPAVVEIHIGASDFPDQLRRLLIWQAAYDAVIGGIGRVQGSPLGSGALLHPNPQFLFRWRILASGDPWTEVPGEFLSVNLSTVESTVTQGARVVGQVIIEDRRVDPTDILYDAAVDDLPATDDIIEFFLIGPIPPEELHPVVVEGITTGEFLKNAYDGVYSARDENGAVVPTGVRYNTAALALMTDIVRIRLSAPIDDLRDWTEKHIYQPTGWVPALDNDGDISPVSQIPPEDTSTLLVITNAVAEPAPDWDAGQRIVNVVRFTYPRDYVVGKPDPAPPTLQVVRPNLLDQRDVVLEFRDELSIQRHGEQVMEISGEAFRAIAGVADATAEESALPSGLPVYKGFVTKLLTKEQFDARVTARFNEQPIVRSAVLALPISGDIADETGYQLALLRDIHVGNRYVYGAPAFAVNVMRAHIPDMRVGDWAWFDLSWLPDYLTQRRGLYALGQVIALGDPDCAWRRLLVEVVTPLAES